MTDAEFEAMTFSTEDEAFSAGIEQYGFVQLVTSRNPDGSWYVFPTSDKIGAFVNERKYKNKKSKVTFKDALAAIAIGAVFAVMLAHGWSLT